MGVYLQLTIIFLQCLSLNGNYSDDIIQKMSHLKHWCFCYQFYDVYCETVDWWFGDLSSRRHDQLKGSTVIIIIIMLCLSWIQNSISIFWNIFCCCLLSTVINAVTIMIKVIIYNFHNKHFYKILILTFIALTICQQAYFKVQLTTAYEI